LLSKHNFAITLMPKQMASTTGQHSTQCTFAPVTLTTIPNPLTVYSLIE
jgi:hypothetical protein